MSRHRHHHRHHHFLTTSQEAIAVLAYTLAADRMRQPLARLKDWLQTNNATVMTVLLLLIGTVMTGNAISNLP